MLVYIGILSIVGDWICRFYFIRSWILWILHHHLWDLSCEVGGSWMEIMQNLMHNFMWQLYFIDMNLHYGNTGCGVFKREVQKDLCLRIIVPKGNFWNLRIGLTGSLSSLQKSEFLKLIIWFFHYFWCQNWDQWHKMSGKNTHIYFFYFWFKNKRKNQKKIKKFQKPKSCRQLP